MKAAAAVVILAGLLAFNTPGGSEPRTDRHNNSPSSDVGTINHRQKFGPGESEAICEAHGPGVIDYAPRNERGRRQAAIDCRHLYESLRAEGIE